MKKFFSFLIPIFIVVALLICVRFSRTLEFGRGKEVYLAQPSSAESLRSLPYVTWSPIKPEDRGKSGVIRFFPELSYQGINLYNSRYKNEAYLMDMQGSIVHRWSSNTDSWQVTELGENGDIFFIAKDKMLGKLDWDSNLEWKIESRFHHWIYLAKNGDIYTLTRDRTMMQHEGRSIPILDDFITVIDQHGVIRDRISVLKLLGTMIPKTRLDAIVDAMNDEKAVIELEEDSVFDVLHTNSVQAIGRNISGVCKEGDILISVRELNIIAIIDPKKQEIIWRWGENDLERQHDAALLESGNISIFDNGRGARCYSRIIEMNPLTKKIEWEYKAQPPGSFYTSGMGSGQKLPNGNMLVTDANSGRVFEITRKGQVVWEFYNPDTTSDNHRATIYRMKRFDPAYVKNS